MHKIYVRSLEVEDARRSKEIKGKGKGKEAKGSRASGLLDPGAWKILEGD
jgi:hypothetical protein